MNEVGRTAAERGMALLELGRARDAEQQLRRALAQEPDNATVLTLLAQAQVRQHRYEEAEDTSGSALAADPEHVPAHSVLAAALGGLGRYDDALRAVRQGLALAPELAGLHLQEAHALIALERHADALASTERAVRLAPNSSAAAALRAAILCDLRRYDEADAAVDEALRLDPENADAHRVRGVIALHRGGGKSAVRAHRTALRLDPTDTHSREALSVALKTRNPLYGWLLRFSLWLETLPRLVRVAVLLTPILLTRLLRPVADQPWAKTLLIVVVVLVLLTWALEPVMNCVLLLGRDRHLLNRAARQATYGFLAFVAATAACWVFAQKTGHGQLMAVTFALGMWAMAVGSAHLLVPGQRKLVWYGTVAAVLLGAMAVVAVLVSAPAAGVAVALVILSGVAALWFMAAAN